MPYRSTGAHRLILALSALLGLAGLLVMPGSAGSAREGYALSGDCDGFPGLSLTTAPDLCVGLVASRLGFPRGVAVIGQDVYVVDLGLGWRKDRGRLLRLRDGGRAAREVLLSGLDRPNGLAAGPGGTLYVGLSGSIVRIDPQARSVKASSRRVLTGLPVDGRHPLAALAVAPDGSLYVNVGSATDNCERPDGGPPDPAAPCPEAVGAKPRGVLLHVRPGPGVVDARGLPPFARGLRNAMALAVLPNGRLLAAVNARDDIAAADPGLSDDALPHDALLRVEAGADFGWPYCYDDRVPSPEYPDFDCASRAAPMLLLPPHSAPLGSLHYRGGPIGALTGHLLIALHGYREAGHRLVALPVDDDGRATGPLRDVISGWEAVSGTRPQGAPVGLAVLADGSVLVTEDHNGTLLRLARRRP